MRSLGNDNARPKQPESFNLNVGEDTQLLVSQQPPSPLSADEKMVDDEHFTESTVPHCDTVPIDGEYDTQMTDLYQETQAVDFDAETQVIDSHEDCIHNLETQLLDDEFATQAVPDSESESMCKTDELVTENDSTDDKCAGKSDDGDTAEKNDMQFSSPSKKGFPPQGFISIRTASIRACGLAALSARTNRSGCRSSSLRGSSQITEELTLKMNGLCHASVSSNYAKEIHQEQAAGRLNDEVEGQRKKNQFVGSSAVRRLFTEDLNIERNSNSYDKGEEENDLAGLSYINSQEPGELSQKNALDFVDRFIKENLDGLHQKFGSKLKTTGVGKSASALSARGPQVLAAKRATIREAGVYDWDDDMEDEGGGDLFCRRKDYFFDGISMPKSKTHPRKEVQSGRLDDCKLNDEPSGFQEKMRGGVRSAPTIKINKVGEGGKKKRSDNSCSKRNLEDDFVALASGKSLRNDSEEICTVGFDMQLAAEAMEKGNQGFEMHCKCARQLRRTNVSKAEMKKKSPISHRRSSRNIKMLRGTTKLNLREKTVDPAISHELDISCSSGEMNNDRLVENIHEVSKVTDPFTPVAHKTRLSVSKGSLRAEIPPRKLQRDTAGEGFIGPHNVEEVQFGPPSRQEGSGKPATKRKRSRDQQTSTSSGSTRQRRLSKGNMVGEDLTVVKSAEDFSNTERNPSTLVESIETETKVKESPREKSKVSNPACVTPTSCSTPSNNASPLYAGNEYFKNSCKNFSRTGLLKEVKRLIASSGPEPSSAYEDTRRKRKDIANVRVLFSHHLGDDITKQQKKIMARLGALEASSISDATHFVTDNFARTRNMLEAIASSKLVVTHLWLESCGQAGCFLDEKNYILRDAKKEREFGFSMPNSLLRASGHPLLQGMRVLITASTEPSNKTMSSLVRAVGGQPAERMGRSALRDNKVPDDLLILSCEEDYDICLPFLKRGASVYSSELVLNGIVIQKLEYERHRLFVDNVKKTRSTVWLKEDGKKFVPQSSKLRSGNLLDQR